MNNTNINNLKIGDTIEIEQAWEDEQGQYHNAYAEILAIADNGELTLLWETEDEYLKAYLDNMDTFMANDYFAEKDWSKKPVIEYEKPFTPIQLVVCYVVLTVLMVVYCWLAFGYHGDTI